MLLILALFAAAPAAQQADMVVTNALIYTGNPSQPQASSLAVRSGRIVAVANNLTRYIGSGTTQVDLKGATVIPGLIDSHVHMAGLGDMLETFDLRAVKTIPQVAEIVRKASATKKPGEWIRGRAWDQTNWGGSFPDASSLTQAAPNHPVFLTRVDGHAGWANRKALEIAGIHKDTPDPPGGRILRDEAGNATGILIDRAQALVTSKIPARTPEQVKRMLRRAAQECSRLGMTTVHDAGIGAAELNAYRELLAAQELPVRIYAMIGGTGDLWQEYQKRGPEIGEHLTVRTIKLMADGAMGSRGAAFWQPYADDKTNSDLLILSREEIEGVARAAVKTGFQVATHAIGDRANRTVLDAYAAVLRSHNDKRFRIEHAQVVSLPDFALFAKYSVIASIQSTHATSDMRWAADRLGPDRLLGAWASRRFQAAGATITNGSDFPVESANPLWGFYAAVTRQDRDGNPPGGFLPDQKLTRAEALHSWTAAGAFAAFQEKDKGTLEPGKLADFVVLSQDIMQVPDRDLLDAKVTMTVVGGKTVYPEGR
ncbi:MAG TPA: amidohydrolase family protein [Bryobacteraceae bacterium]|nr:amidohydrolase family protein [Bryobacteraceae bacterium]